MIGLQKLPSDNPYLRVHLRRVVQLSGYKVTLERSYFALTIACTSYSRLSNLATARLQHDQYSQADFKRHGLEEACRTLLHRFLIDLLILDLILAGLAHPLTCLSSGLVKTVKALFNSPFGRSIGICQVADVSRLIIQTKSYTLCWGLISDCCLLGCAFIPV